MNKRVEDAEMRLFDAKVFLNKVLTEEYNLSFDDMLLINATIVDVIQYVRDLVKKLEGGHHGLHLEGVKDYYEEVGRVGIEGVQEE